MKKIYHLLFLFVIASGFSQSGTVTIGEGNLVSSTMPVFSFYQYNYSQQIVSKETFNAAGGTAGSITKLRYYCVHNGSSIEPWNDWTISIGHTTKSVFTGGDWVSPDELTQVFSGTFTPVAETWIEFEFDEPFEYNDIDNIVISVDENAAGWTAAGDAAQFYSYFTAGNQATGMRFASDSVNFDPTLELSIYTETSSQVPMLQFEGQLLSTGEQSLATISVYPNPTRGSVSVSFSGNDSLEEASVYDLSGREVFTQTSFNSGNAIDLAHLQPASYILKLKTASGTTTQKVIKI